MLLKSMKVYRITPPTSQAGDVEAFKSGLSRQLAQGCPKDRTLAFGWESPFGQASEELVASTSGVHLFSFAVSSRLLPQDVIKQTVADRVIEIESRQGVPVSKKEQRRLMDEVHFELLPKAFVQKKKLPLIWDSESNLLMVGGTQSSLLDSLITCWTYCLPGWRIKPIDTQTGVQRLLTQWQKNDSPMPSIFQWGDACQLIDPQDKYCSIRFTGNELTGQSVKQPIADGMMVKQAALQWHDKLKFVLSEGLQVSQIKTLDVESEAEQGQSSQERLMMDLALMGPMLRLCVQDLIEASGGEIEVAKPVTEPLVEAYE